MHTGLIRTKLLFSNFTMWPGNVAGLTIGTTFRSPRFGNLVTNLHVHIHVHIRVVTAQYLMWLLPVWIGHCSACVAMSPGTFQFCYCGPGRFSHLIVR